MSSPGQPTPPKAANSFTASPWPTADASLAGTSEALLSRLVLPNSHLVPAGRQSQGKPAESLGARKSVSFSLRVRGPGPAYNSPLPDHAPPQSQTPPCNAAASAPADQPQEQSCEACGTDGSNEAVVRRLFRAVQGYMDSPEPQPKAYPGWRPQPFFQQTKDGCAAAAVEGDSNGLLQPGRNSPSWPHESAGHNRAGDVVGGRLDAGADGGGDAMAGLAMDALALHRVRLALECASRVGSMSSDWPHRLAAGTCGSTSNIFRQSPPAAGRSLSSRFGVTSSAAVSETNLGAPGCAPQLAPASKPSSASESWTSWQHGVHAGVSSRPVADASAPQPAAPPPPPPPASGTSRCTTQRPEQQQQQQQQPEQQHHYHQHLLEDQQQLEDRPEATFEQVHLLLASLNLPTQLRDDADEAPAAVMPPPGGYLAASMGQEGAATLTATWATSPGVGAPAAATAADGSAVLFPGAPCVGMESPSQPAACSLRWPFDQSPGLGRSPCGSKSRQRVQAATGPEWFEAALPSASASWLRSLARGTVRRREANTLELEDLSLQLREARTERRHVDSYLLGVRLGMAKPRLARLQALAAASGAPPAATAALLAQIEDRLRLKLALRALQLQAAARGQLLELAGARREVSGPVMAAAWLCWKRAAQEGEKLRVHVGEAIAARQKVRRARALLAWHAVVQRAADLRHREGVLRAAVASRCRHRTVLSWHSQARRCQALRANVDACVASRLRRTLLAWRAAAHDLRTSAQQRRRADAHCRSRLLLASLAHWRFLHVSRTLGRVWEAALTRRRRLQVLGKALRVWHFYARRCKQLIRQLAGQQAAAVTGSMPVVDEASLPVPLSLAAVPGLIRRVLAGARGYMLAMSDELLHLRAFMRFSLSPPPPEVPVLQQQSRGICVLGDKGVGGSAARLSPRLLISGQWVHKQQVLLLLAQLRQVERRMTEVDGELEAAERDGRMVRLGLQQQADEIQQRTTASQQALAAAQAEQQRLLSDLEQLDKEVQAVSGYLGRCRAVSQAADEHICSVEQHLAEAEERVRRAAAEAEEAQAREQALKQQHLERQAAAAEAARQQPHPSVVRAQAAERQGRERLLAAQRRLSEALQLKAALMAHWRETQVVAASAPPYAGPRHALRVGEAQQQVVEAAKVVSLAELEVQQLLAAVDSLVQATRAASGEDETVQAAVSAAAAQAAEAAEQAAAAARAARAAAEAEQRARAAVASLRLQLQQLRQAREQELPQSPGGQQAVLLEPLAARERGLQGELAGCRERAAAAQRELQGALAAAAALSQHVEGAEVSYRAQLLRLQPARPKLEQSALQLRSRLAAYPSELVRQMRRLVDEHAIEAYQDASGDWAVRNLPPEWEPALRPGQLAAAVAAAASDDESVSTCGRGSSLPWRTLRRRPSPPRNPFADPSLAHSEDEASSTTSHSRTGDMGAGPLTGLLSRRRSTRPSPLTPAAAAAAAATSPGSLLGSMSTAQLARVARSVLGSAAARSVEVRLDVGPAPSGPCSGGGGLAVTAPPAAGGERLPGAGDEDRGSGDILRSWLGFSGLHSTGMAGIGTASGRGRDSGSTPGAEPPARPGTQSLPVLPQSQPLSTLGVQMARRSTLEGAGFFPSHFSQLFAETHHAGGLAGRGGEGSLTRISAADLAASLLPSVDRTWSGAVRPAPRPQLTRSRSLAGGTPGGSSSAAAYQITTPSPLPQSRRLLRMFERVLGHTVADTPQESSSIASSSSSSSSSCDGAPGDLSDNRGSGVDPVRDPSSKLPGPTCAPSSPAAVPQARAVHVHDPHLPTQPRRSPDEPDQADPSSWCGVAPGPPDPPTAAVPAVGLHQIGEGQGQSGAWRPDDGRSLGAFALPPTLHPGLGTVFGPASPIVGYVGAAAVGPYTRTIEPFWMQQTPTGPLGEPCPGASGLLRPPCEGGFDSLQPGHLNCKAPTAAAVERSALGSAPQPTVAVRGLDEAACLFYLRKLCRRTIQALREHSAQLASLASHLRRISREGRLRWALLVWLAGVKDPPALAKGFADARARRRCFARWRAGVAAGRRLAAALSLGRQRLRGGRLRGCFHCWVDWCGIQAANRRAEDAAHKQRLRWLLLRWRLGLQIIAAARRQEAAAKQTYSRALLRRCLQHWLQLSRAYQLLRRVFRRAEDLWEEYAEAAASHSTEYGSLLAAFQQLRRYRAYSLAKRSERIKEQSAIAFRTSLLLVRVFAAWQAAVVATWRDRYVVHMVSRLLRAWRRLAHTQRELPYSLCSLRRRLRLRGFSAGETDVRRHWLLRSTLSALTATTRQAFRHYAHSLMRRGLAALAAAWAELADLVEQHRKSWRCALLRQWRDVAMAGSGTRRLVRAVKAGRDRRLLRLAVAAWRVYMKLVHEKRRAVSVATRHYERSVGFRVLRRLSYGRDAWKLAVAHDATRLLRPCISSWRLQASSTRLKRDALLRTLVAADPPTLPGPQRSFMVPKAAAQLHQQASAPAMVTGALLPGGAADAARRHADCVATAAPNRAAAAMSVRLYDRRHLRLHNPPAEPGDETPLGRQHVEEVKLAGGGVAQVLVLEQPKVPNRNGDAVGADVAGPWRRGHSNLSTSTLDVESDLAGSSGGASDVSAAPGRTERLFAGSAPLQPYSQSWETTSDVSSLPLSDMRGDHCTGSSASTPLRSLTSSMTMQDLPSDVSSMDAATLSLWRRYAQHQLAEEWNRRRVLLRVFAALRAARNPILRGKRRQFRAPNK